MSVDPIDDVISKLEKLIQWSKDCTSRVGYFASLYLRVTHTIRGKIGTGYFDNDERMERLDATFAGRYLKAVEQFQNNDPSLPEAWAVAFQATEQDDFIIVQHLLVAMNPHINIDLGVAAAEIAPGDTIHDLHSDFLKINDILSSLVPIMISKIGSLSPLIHLLDDIAENDEIEIINFSMKAARNYAWTLALTLAYLAPEQQQKIIDQENPVIAALSSKILNPGFTLDSVVSLIQSVESKDIKLIIDTLNAGDPSPASMTEPDDFQKPASTQTPPNHVYYFEIAAGSWTGDFTFKVKDWSGLWLASISLKNKFLVCMMGLFQKIFGNSSISSVITAYPSRGKFGVVRNNFRIYKFGLTLFRSHEDYILSLDGTGVKIDAHVRFGPIPFLFNEHDIYPAEILDGGMRAAYNIKLLGTRFIGKYKVHTDRRQVHSLLENEWALADETLNKVKS